MSHPLLARALDELGVLVHLVRPTDPSLGGHVVHRRYQLYPFVVGSILSWLNIESCILGALEWCKMTFCCCDDNDVLDCEIEARPKWPYAPSSCWICGLGATKDIAMSWSTCLWSYCKALLFRACCSGACGGKHLALNSWIWLYQGHLGYIASLIKILKSMLTSSLLGSWVPLCLRMWPRLLKAELQGSMWEWWVA